MQGGFGASLYSVKLSHYSAICPFVSFRLPTLNFKLTGIFQRIVVRILNEPHPSPPQPRSLGREGLGELKKQPLNHEEERMKYKTSNFQVKLNSYEINNQTAKFATGRDDCEGKKL